MIKRCTKPTRRDDERVLEWLILRDAGKTTAEIAADYGVTKNTVIGATTRVMRES